MPVELRPHTSHWGAFDALVENGSVVGVRPFTGDTDPSPILENIPGSVRHPTRIAQPMIRAGWLDRGPGADTRRGAEPFVPVNCGAIPADLFENRIHNVLDIPLVQMRVVLGDTLNKFGFDHREIGPGSVRMTISVKIP